MKKILITGCCGMLGNVLIEEILPENQIILGVDMNEPKKEFPFTKLDLTNESSTKKLLNDFKPDVIIHTAAYTNVDFCEKNPSIVDRLHIDATKVLADYSNKRSKLIFISSDSVFKGNQGNYKEDDIKYPLNYYAKTKDIAEEIIKSTCDDFIIVRTNIFGFHLTNGNSLVEWALNKLISGERINGFTDVRFNAIYTRFLSKIIYEMITMNLKGIFHVCSKNSLSKFEFLQLLATDFNLNINLISPVKIDDLGLDANRPKDSTLNTSKISQIIALPSIEEGIRRLHDDYLGDKIVK